MINFVIIKTYQLKEVYGFRLIYFKLNYNLNQFMNLN